MSEEKYCSICGKPIYDDAVLEELFCDCDKSIFAYPYGCTSNQFKSMREAFYASSKPCQSPFLINRTDYKL